MQRRKITGAAQSTTLVCTAADVWAAEFREKFSELVEVYKTKPKDLSVYPYDLVNVLENLQVTISETKYY